MHLGRLCIALHDMVPLTAAVSAAEHTVLFVACRMFALPHVVSHILLPQELGAPLVIKDPLDPLGNNVGRTCFGFDQVQVCACAS